MKDSYTASLSWLFYITIYTYNCQLVPLSKLTSFIRWPNFLILNFSFITVASIMKDSHTTSLSWLFYITIYTYNCQLVPLCKLTTSIRWPNFLILNFSFITVASVMKDSHTTSLSWLFYITIYTYNCQLVPLSKLTTSIRWPNFLILNFSCNGTACRKCGQPSWSSFWTKAMITLPKHKTKERRKKNPSQMCLYYIQQPATIVTKLFHNKFISTKLTAECWVINSCTGLFRNKVAYMFQIFYLGDIQI